MRLRNSVLLHVLVSSYQIFLRLYSRNVRLCLWLLDLFLFIVLFPRHALNLLHSVDLSLPLLDFIFCESLLRLNHILIIVVHLLDENSVALNGTTVIVQSQSITRGVLIVVEDKLFAD